MVNFNLATIQGYGGYNTKEGFFQDWNKIAEQEKYQSFLKSKKK